MSCIGLPHSLIYLIPVSKEAMLFQEASETLQGGTQDFFCDGLLNVRCLAGCSFSPWYSFSNVTKFRYSSLQTWCYGSLSCSSHYHGQKILKTANVNKYFNHYVFLSGSLLVVQLYKVIDFHIQILGDITIVIFLSTKSCFIKEEVIFRNPEI